MRRILIEVDVPEETFATPVWYDSLDILASKIEGKVVGVFFSGRKPIPVDPNSTNIHLTEDEKSDISMAFDAWGHDYTLLFPVVEKIIKDRLEKK